MGNCNILTVDTENEKEVAMDRKTISKRFNLYGSDRASFAVKLDKELNEY